MMKRFAQILYDKAHYIFEAEEKPEFAPNIVLVDITGQDEIQEGWDYDTKSGEFTPPVIIGAVEPPQSLSVEEMQAQTLLNTEYLVSRSELGLGGN